jgi:proteasome accessory factor A
VEEQADAPAEAYEVLRSWDDALDRLERAPETLVGSLDWVTKEFLLDRAGSNLGWAERKKIDIRYHELSDEGYYHVLAKTGITAAVVDAQDVERAMRSAPPNSPATTRGHYIREFADGDDPLAVNWKRIQIGRGKGAKVVRLHRYRRSGGTEDQNNLDSAARW